VANSQHAVNHTVSGVRVLSSLQRALEIGSYQTAWAMLAPAALRAGAAQKIVPAVTDVAERHDAQRRRPSPSRHPPACAQAGQTNPSGHRSHSR
jgi:hypothetical protein